MEIFLDLLNVMMKIGMPVEKLGKMNVIINFKLIDFKKKGIFKFVNVMKNRENCKECIPRTKKIKRYFVRWSFHWKQRRLRNTKRKKHAEAASEKSMVSKRNGKIEFHFEAKEFFKSFIKAVKDKQESGSQQSTMVDCWSWLTKEELSQNEWAGKPNSWH